MTVNRLDILLYAHDGRGLGHVGRTVGIGMAVRRLFPELRVLVATGASQCAELIDSAPLDWLKLPSYRTEVIDGKSTGVDGASNFTDRELGILRARTLKTVVDLYRPRVVLADHAPQGKHGELLPAMAAARDSKWILGVRGVTGSVAQVHSARAASVFRDHYDGLLWYGDSGVLGTSHRDRLCAQFGSAAFETGYVSRLLELLRFRNDPLNAPDRRRPSLAGTVSIPWFGEAGARTAARVARALGALGSAYGAWHVYLGDRGEPCAGGKPFEDLSHCQVRPFGRQYAGSLLRSRVALIYGGYNSLVDCLATRIPAVVLLRDMQDNEQRQHLKLVCRRAERLIAIEEAAATPETLSRLLTMQLDNPERARHGIAVDGAANTARFLAGLVRESR